MSPLANASASASAAATVAVTPSVTATVSKPRIYPLTTREQINILFLSFPPSERARLLTFMSDLPVKSSAKG